MATPSHRVGRRRRRTCAVPYLYQGVEPPGLHATGRGNNLHAQPFFLR